jgi:hypothetical protein
MFWKTNKQKLDQAKKELEKASTKLFVAQVKYKHYLDLVRLKKNV